MPKKLGLNESDDETRLSQIRGIGNTALQKLAASGLVRDFDPKITLGEIRSLKLNYKQLLSKGIRGAAWKNILGEDIATTTAPPLLRQPASQGLMGNASDDNKALQNPTVNPFLPPVGAGNPTGDPQLATRPDETPEVLAMTDQPDTAEAKAVPTGMLAGGQAAMCVIPDVQLNISPGDATIVQVAQPAADPLYPIAPAASLGPQQGIVGARQVDAQTHEQVVRQQAMGLAEPPTSKADGSGDIGDDGRGALAMDNEEQKRIDGARRMGFRVVPMDISGATGGGGRAGAGLPGVNPKTGQPTSGIAPGQPRPPGFPGGAAGAAGAAGGGGAGSAAGAQETKELANPYRQASLFRNFDASISGSKMIRTRAAQLASSDTASALALRAQQDPSFQKFNPMTQGVWGWAEPFTTSNNFLDRSNQISSLQYYGAQGLQNIYDPAPIYTSSQMMDESF